MDRVAVYDSLAKLLSYPDSEYLEQVKTCRLLLAEKAPALSERLQDFSLSLDGLSQEQMEELFTRTFDLNPVCSLEIGWHLFGENYERGTLMARLRRELKQHGVQETGELPDHLTHVLPLLGRMETEPADDFYAACVAPALVKMRGAFHGKKDEPFATPFDVICRWLHAQHGSLLAEMPPAAVQLPILQEVVHE